ncbi:F-box protein [Quillaja saponaria]|uniref:F-box protein n=1 Tax=Quillaja saponaria TaxID=32244 RepID=A0AAD7LBJ5_QUISA|nr:F-box protein [Quillaja saponaria]
MRVLRAINKSRNKGRSNYHASTIKSLPSEHLKEVLARVGSDSFIDLYMAKQTCKEFLRIAEDDYIYKNISMEKFPRVPWKPSNQVAQFLRRCEEAGNAEALFRRGMLEYFTHVRRELGTKYLRMAAQKGHMEARYVYGILLMCYNGGDKVIKQKGFELLCLLRRDKCVTKCRKRVKEFISIMWINCSVQNDQALICCWHSKTCNDNWKAKTGGRSSLSDDEDDEDDDVVCQFCGWDKEVKLFCNMFGVHN